MSNKRETNGSDDKELYNKKGAIRKVAQQLKDSIRRHSKKTEIESPLDDKRIHQGLTDLYSKILNEKQINLVAGWISSLAINGSPVEREVINDKLESVFRHEMRGHFLDESDWTKKNKMYILYKIRRIFNGPFTVNRTELIGLLRELIEWDLDDKQLEVVNEVIESLKE